MNHYYRDNILGILGTAVPISASLFLDSAEQWLRIISLLIGIVVGIATLINQTRHWSLMSRFFTKKEPK